MRKIALIVALLLAPIVALAQYYLRPNVPPQSVIGNPYSINAPAQAIPFGTLNADIGAANLLTPVLPSTVDLNNLPPQTVIGNSTSSPAGLGFITFSQLLAFKTQAGLPATIYNTYDPTNIPGFAMVGNLSATRDALALPISIANFFSAISLNGGLLLEDNASFLLLEDASSHLCLEGGC